MPERAEGDKSKARQLSRLELDAKIWASQERGRKREEYQPSMPPVDGAAYLIGDLFTPGEVGITVAGAMGAGPLTHGAIRNWMKNTGSRRSPWEIRCLIRLSHEYLAESHRAEERGCESPWQPDDQADKREIG